jgi:hypothetical protein
MSGVVPNPPLLPPARVEPDVEVVKEGVVKYCVFQVGEAERL